MTRKQVLGSRRAGVLLHIGSLPSGKLDDAERFLDLVRDCGFSVWQVLPLGPSGAGRSPYSPLSAFAGDTGMLPDAWLAEPVERQALDEFREREAGWLRDYALFAAIRKAQNGQPWWQWPGALRNRDGGALRQFERDHENELLVYARGQCHFERAWRRLRSQAAERGILMLGDLPMFVMANSADAWTHPEYFDLDESGRPRRVAGVPPDAYSDRGQSWDCPVYNWPAMAQDHFAWWAARLRHELKRFDLLRWDHFRGLVATWQIPVPDENEMPLASSGAWHSVPGKSMLEALDSKLGALPLVAENLGIITPEVESLRHEFGLPGMHLLQFAFDGEPRNPHLPAQHEEQGVAYSGTHDNDTTAGWCAALDFDTRQRAMASLGCSAAELPGAIKRAVLESRSRLAILPMQDLLGLGSYARLNTPGQAAGQWRWRFSWDELNPLLIERWREAVRQSGRQAA